MNAPHPFSTGRRMIVTAALLLLGLIATTGIAPAQGTKLCLPDCLSDSLQGPFVDTLCVQPPNCPTCVRLEVTFYKRRACNTWWDVQVTNIKSIDPVYSQCMGLNIPPAYYFQQALLLIMTDPSNPTGFPPHMPGQCVTQWRISVGGCQRIEGHNPDPTHPSWWQLQITACDEEICCLTPFTVCLASDGVTRTATPTGSSSPTSNCPEADPQTWEWGEECYQVCGWADWELFD